MRAKKNLAVINQIFVILSIEHPIKYSYVTQRKRYV